MFIEKAIFIHFENTNTRWKQQEMKIISEKNQSLKILDHRFEEASKEIKQQSQAQTRFNISDENCQVQIQRLTKLYKSEKESIIQMFNTKISSLNTIKEQCLASLNQRLLLLKRQKEELTNGQQKNNSQNELLKPKAASSRPIAPYFTCKAIPFFKNPNESMVQEEPLSKVQTHGLRPRTPGGPVVCKPRTQKHDDLNF